MRAIAVLLVTLAFVSCSSSSSQDEAATREAPAGPAGTAAPGRQIHYLEVVTEDVDAVCRAYASVDGLQFSAPDSLLGFARTAPLPGGGFLGVRAPLSTFEEPVVRPYRLVADIEAALASAVAAGATVAHEPLLIPGRGTFAIYLLGGNQHGLWEL